MNTTRAFFSLVQYVPDAGRSEGANVGVVLFIPKRPMLVRTSTTLRRVRSFFKPKATEMDRIKQRIEALRSRLGLATEEFRNESEFSQFVAASADAVQLTPPRLVMVTDPEADLNSLFDELVGEDPSSNSSPRRKSPALPPAVEKVVAKLEESGKAWRPGKVTIPTVGRGLKVHAAFQNGRTNYVRAESLNMAANNLDKHLEMLGFNGLLLHQHKVDDRDCSLVVVSASPGADPQDEKQFSTALADFRVRFVPYRDVAKFAGEIEKTAH